MVAPRFSVTRTPWLTGRLALQRNLGLGRFRVPGPGSSVVQDTRPARAGTESRFGAGARPGPAGTGHSLRALSGSAPPSREWHNGRARANAHVGRYDSAFDWYSHAVSAATAQQPCAPARLRAPAAQRIRRRIAARESRRGRVTLRGDAAQHAICNNVRRANAARLTLRKPSRIEWRCVQPSEFT